MSKEDPSPMAHPQRSRFTPRPTVYRGIQMRSRLEAKVAAILDEHRVNWTYEPQCYASPSGQYLPDFELHYSEKAPMMLEVKGFLASDAAREGVQKQMEVVWESDPEYVLGLLVFDKEGGAVLWAAGPRDNPTCWGRSSWPIPADEIGQWLCLQGCQPCRDWRAARQAANAQA